MAKVRRKLLPDGRVMVVREDGATYIMDPQGGRTDVSGPNPDMAEAFYADDASTLDEQIAAITAWQQSEPGQRADRLRAEAYDEDVRRFNAGMGLQRDQLGLSREIQRGQLGIARQNAQTNRMETEARIAELERRFGLDVARFGTDYVKTAIEYAKTPRSWVSSLLWEGGATPIYQNLAAGRQMPLFAAKGSAASQPAMNNITDTVSALGFSNAGQMPDPTKQLQQIIKAVPPGGSPPGQINDTEAAVLNLAKALYQSGGTNMPEGVWESYDRDVQDTLLGAMDYVAPNGGDRFLRQLGRTRLPTAVNPNAA